MGIYNTFTYYDGTLYGQNSKLEYSVSPFTAAAIDVELINGVLFPKARVSWNNPSGTILAFRLLRNQEHFSETAEDGEILLETIRSLPDSTTFDDQFVGTRLREGKFAFYSVWILKSDYSWTLAGGTHCLIPRAHNTLNPDGTVLKTSHDKFLEMFPRVYTTQGKSYVDEIDKTSDFCKFMEGFSYTLDEWMTEADLLRPDARMANTVNNMLQVKAVDLGLKRRPWATMHSQKMLVRDAIYTYQNSGTRAAIESVSEGVSGYSAQVSVLPNKMLSIQDSSFYKGIGNWVAGTGCTLEAKDDYAVGVSAETIYATDLDYTGKVTVATSNAIIKNGTDNPTLTGIPVTAGSEYELSYFVKSPSSTMNVTPYIKWYDLKGQLLSTTTGTASAVSSSWAQKTLTATAQGAPVDVNTVKVTYATGTATARLRIDTQEFSVGDFVKVASVGYPYDGTKEITAVGTETVDTVTYDYIEYEVPLTESVDLFTVAGTVRYPEAAFASIEVGFAATGVVYVDRFQFADTSDVDSTLYTEGRGVEVHLLPSKMNHVSNPAFAGISGGAVAGWDIAGSATATEYSLGLDEANPLLDDASALKLETSGTATTANSPLLATEITGQSHSGEFYSFSIYGKAEADVSLTLELEAVDPTVQDTFQTYDITATEVVDTVATLEFTGTMFKVGDVILVDGVGSPYDGTHTVIEVSEGESNTVSYVLVGQEDVALDDSGVTGTVALTLLPSLVTKTISLTDSWSRHSATIFIPNEFSVEDTVVTARIYGDSDGLDVYFQAAQYEDGYTSTDYFDGDMSLRGAYWSGTSNDSSSYMYNNRSNRLGVLSAELPSYLPMNTSFIITTGGENDKQLEFYGVSS